MKKIIKWPLDKLALIIPKSKFYLPLHFKNNRYFQSKRVTVLSFLIIIFVMWNVFHTYHNIGSISNISMSVVKFESNLNLTEKYRSIQLKPRKYKHYFYSDDSSNKDSLLPFFIV